MGVGLWVIGTEKGGRGGGLLWDKASAKLLAVPGKCTADRSRLNRAGMSVALQVNECGVFACTHIESVRLPSCWLCLANAQQIRAD